MLKRWAFFIAFVLAVSLCYGDEPSLDLEPIVVTKRSFKNSYSLETSPEGILTGVSIFEAASYLPLDLQSRLLKADIQTDFSLRGSTYQGVLMLLDGQRINDPQTGHHNSDIPLTTEDIQGITVLPASSSSFFGPDAIGGAINIRVKKPEGKKTVIQVGGGSHNSNSFIASISRSSENRGLRLSLERQESTGFRDDTAFRKFTASINSYLDIPDGTLKLLLGYQDKAFGAYDFYTPGLGYPSKEWTKTYLLDSGIELEKGDFLIKPNFLWRRHHDKFMLDKTGTRSGSVNRHENNMYTPNIYFQAPASFIGKAGLGLEYGEERIDSTNLGKHNRLHNSVFLDDTKDLTPRLSLALAGRSDDYNSFGRNYTGSFGLAYKILKGQQVHFNISRSIRVPSFTELYYSDPTTAGDSGLSAEKCLNYEIGYDYKKEKLSLRINLFLRQEDDVIDWVKTTSTQAKWKAQNISRTNVLGVEEYLKLELNKFISLDSNYTYISKQPDSGYIYKYGPNYASHLVNFLFNFNFPFGAQAVALSYKKKPGRDGWFLANLRLAYKIHKYGQVFFNASNLLNKKYQEIKGISQPGRWIEAGLRFDW